MYLSGGPRRARLLVAVAIMACGLALARPQRAHAGWPLASRACVALAFGETYRAADATSASTHHGVDLASSPGASVLAPLAGDVTFAGQVPGVGGGGVLAVTIMTARGSVTLLPLESAPVKRGAHLSAGERVGTLAADGDGSSAGTHLHVGLKQGDLYVDPLGVMTPPPAASPAAGGPATHPAPSVHGTVGAAGAARAAASPHTAAHCHPATEPGAEVSAASVSAHAAVPGAKLAPGVSIAGPPAQERAAEIPEIAHAIGPSANSTPEAVTPSLAPLLDRAIRFAQRSARGAAWALLGVLAALGALWPVWRSAPVEGSRKVRVRPTGDDVAAVSGR